MRGESTYLRYSPLIFYNFPTNTNSQKQNFLFICFLFYLFFQNYYLGRSPHGKPKRKDMRVLVWGLFLGSTGKLLEVGLECL